MCKNVQWTEAWATNDRVSKRKVQTMHDVYPEARQNELSSISKHNGLPLREETENQEPLSVTIMITVACWTIAESDFGRLAGGLQKTCFCINYARIVV